MRCQCWYQNSLKRKQTSRYYSNPRTKPFSTVTKITFNIKKSKYPWENNINKKLKCSKQTWIVFKTSITNNKKVRHFLQYTITSDYYRQSIWRFDWKRSNGKKTLYESNFTLHLRLAAKVNGERTNFVRCWKNSAPRSVTSM